MLVGLNKADDAGVYKINEDLAIVQTVDFITPIVDDPYSFGMIAAANALSDVYAMGGKPITAMNVVCFPSETMDISVLNQILRGALAKLNEADVALVGGHSVKDDELKYGLSVTGIIHPQRIITNSGAMAGDKLILTKPLGTGILNTAVKAGLVSDEIKTRLIEQMAQLNREASEVMVSMEAHACTDITGFGLIGHACEMAENSSVSIELCTDKVPFISEALQFAQMGIIPEGMYTNREFRILMVEGNLADEELMDVFYDPQTSGGLLIAVPPKSAEVMLTRLRKAGYKEAAIIGQLVSGAKSRIRLI